ncbi:MAG: cytochrome c oxidase subunit II [Dehalococcoidia bacterium]|jgi:cytochrome c oxidase subunit 2|nr:cytochrome c oxidase subunit II [Dehalococcoidia bacterium]
MNLRRLLPPARSRSLFLLPVVPAVLAACNKGDAQSTFGTSGPVADTQANLFIFIFWIAVAVFVLVEGALIYSIIRFRRRGSDDSLPDQTHGNNKLEVIWTAIPVLILIAIAIPTVKIIYDQDGPPPDQGPVLDIKVRAHQWWWEVEYPGEDVVTANEIHIPIGQWVNFTMHSDDVIHSFWVPKLAGKMDIVPGDVRQLAMKADEGGMFFGQCAEFCGEAHAKMRFRVKAEEPEAFQDWLDSMRRPPAELVSDDAIAGQKVFTDNCGSCHATNTWQAPGARNERTRLAGLRSAYLDDRNKADGDRTNLIAAPNLTHFGTRDTLGAGLISLTRDNLVEWIADPDDIKEGNRMKELARPYRENTLTSEDVRQLAAYLMELKPVAADAVMEPDDGTAGGTAVERGASTFDSSGCSGCHSTGSDDRLGPGLAGISARQNDDYIRESIINPGAFVVEGFSPVMTETFGDTLSSDELNDLIAYLKTL